MIVEKMIQQINVLGLILQKEEVTENNVTGMVINVPFRVVCSEILQSVLKHLVLIIISFQVQMIHIMKIMKINMFKH